MWILDTDLVTLLQRRSQPEYDRLQVRFDAIAANDLCVSIITVQEQFRGWLAEVNRASKRPDILVAYRGLLDALHYFTTMDVIPFDGPAQDQFESLRRQRIRISTLDLRIASIALAQRATLLSRNLRDFAKVPGLVVEDWTK